MVELIKRNSIKMYNGMVVEWPFYEEEKIFDIERNYEKHQGSYAMNNSVICFVADNGVFVTPYTTEVIETIRTEGFHEGNFYVPFSNWDYPKKERRQWDSLLKNAEEERNRAFESDCISYAERHGIKALPLANTLEIPKEGIRVLFWNSEKTTYFPVVSQTGFDSVVADKIGKFAYNNGVVIFLHQDGKTYVAKGYRITHALRAAGYNEYNLFVPFSNGEQIVDPEVRERWNRLITY